MGKLASKFMETKTFYNLTILAQPKARCFKCRKWSTRNTLFKVGTKRYCAGCTPSDHFNNVITDYQPLPTQCILRDDTPLL